MTRFKIIIVILGIALSGVLFSTNYASAAAQGSGPGPGAVRVGVINASGHDQFCAPNNECLNAYGAGPSVKTNPPGALNNAFGVFRTTQCANGYTSANCPMTGNPVGLQIVELVDEDGGLFQGNCIGDYGNSSTRADAGVNVACGGYGTVNIWDGNTSCLNNFSLFVNAKWSGYNWASAREIGFATGNSKTVYLNNNGFSCLQESGF